MGKKHLLVSAVAALVFVSIEAGDAVASPKVDRTVRNIEMTLNNCAIDQYWDGNAIKPGVSAEVTNGWLHSCVSNLNRAIGYYNSLNMIERMSPGVVSKDIKGRLDSYQKFAKAAQGNQQVAAASAQASQNVCMMFGNMTSDAKTKYVEHLINVQQDKNHYIVPDDFPKTKEAADAVQKLCTDNPALAQLGSNSCPMYRTNGSGADWCSAAAKQKELLGMLLASYASRNLSNIQMNPDKFEEYEGWFRVNGKVEYKSMFTVSDDEKKSLAKALAKPIEIIGDTSQLNAIYDQIAKSREPLRKKVDQFAPTWTIKAMGTSKHYSQDLARKTVLAWHPSAKIVKNFMDNAGYHIDRNALGVPVARRIYGGIIFQVPGEPWCQYRTFRAREEYKSGNSYHKTNQILMDNLRFQSCKN